ncbi:hypothetical protein EGR_05415 [Echinococcus granulosus]|uniref:Uncharacterized protein n=1 Tax=Echinococcus granulosus TaxID=6210 RepID=W6UEY4_ECHGR|nr:hypothetical protein EGR_05415 [Echinococcus granulosus]EUB59653.1 hypothetical protein EGR_05415 [Echinococcus granulosus]
MFETALHMANSHRRLCSAVDADALEQVNVRRTQGPHGMPCILNSSSLICRFSCLLTIFSLVCSSSPIISTSVPI